MRARRSPSRARPVAGAVLAAALLTAACATSATPAPVAPAVTSPSTSIATTGSPVSTPPSPPATSPATSAAPRTSAAVLPAPPAHRTSSVAAPPPPAAPAGSAPVIVIDPGHSVAISHVDPATGIVDSDYENEPEMRDVFSVALLVRARLQAAGYRVLLTKNSLDQPMSLGERAAVANSAHARLALSIHDQAGANGGIAFAAGNNIVYYQAVGDYRANQAGRHIVFTNAAVAAVSEQCGTQFQAAREAAEGHPVTLQGNVGYDLGSRGLAPGNIWTVQLLSQVPWIYNEAGGNSAGQIGLSAADQQRYANGLVTGVERCVPL